MHNSCGFNARSEAEYSFRENAIWLPKGAKGKAIAERAVWETYEYKIRGESNESNQSR